MATTTLQLDSSKIVEPLKEINELLSEIISKFETLRELAEMKDLQSFVTLTPTINVCNTSSSASEVIERITEALEKEITTATSKTSS